MRDERPEYVVRASRARHLEATERDLNKLKVGAELIEAGDMLQFDTCRSGARHFVKQGVVHSDTCVEAIAI